MPQPIRQNSAEILLQANLIQSPPPSLLLLHSYSASQSTPACIHSILATIFLVADFFIHPFIGWPSPFPFWSASSWEIQSKYGISVGASALRVAYHPMNSLAPPKALLSGRPLAFLGNLNGLLWVFYEEGGGDPSALRSVNDNNAAPRRHHLLHKTPFKSQIKMIEILEGGAAQPGWIIMYFPTPDLES